jgi:hypothetical protein
MPNPFKKNPSQIDTLISRAASNLDLIRQGTEDYTEALKTLQELHELKMKETPSWRVSPDTVLLCAVNLIGIAMITRYEKTEIVTSKAQSFVARATP